MRGRRTSTGVAPRAPPSGTATRRREPGGGEPPRAVAADHRALPQRDRGYMRGLRTSTGVSPRAPPSGTATRRREPGGWESPRAVARRYRAQATGRAWRARRTSTGVAPRAPPSGMVRQRALLPCRTATPHAWCTRRQGLGRGKGAIDGTPQSKRGRGNRSVFSGYQRHSTRICFFVSSTINFQRFWFASFDNFTCFSFGPFPFHARMGYFPGFTPLAATGRINAS